MTWIHASVSLYSFTRYIAVAAGSAILTVGLNSMLLIGWWQCIKTKATELLVSLKAETAPADVPAYLSPKLFDFAYGLVNPVLTGCEWAARGLVSQMQEIPNAVLCGLLGDAFAVTLFVAANVLLLKAVHLARRQAS